MKLSTKENRQKRTGLFIILMIFGLALQAQQSFTNPLLPSGADPWCLYKDGYYYYTHTTGRNITLWKTDNIAQLNKAEKKVIFTPPPHTAYSMQLWAPELHFLRHHWYLYFAADSGDNRQHRLWVLECKDTDPLNGQWVLKGKLQTPGDKWSIDGTVYEGKKHLYLLWSGWENDKNGQQNIYIAQLKNPWTVEGRRVLLSAPTLDWEVHGDLKNSGDVPQVKVNEGPEILQKGHKLFLIYSGSGCWTDYYALGMLSTTTDKDIMKASAWTKSPEPVFRQSPENGVYAPGHNSFFRSPDGKEDWILYHANSRPGQGCGKFRSPRAQKFTWKTDGTPDFGTPVKENVAIPVPAEKQGPKRAGEKS